MGGAIAAEPAPGGGTLMRLRLPGLEAVRDEPDEQGTGERKPAGVRP